ncbi:MAG: lipoyl synthase [candidate division Zixibacteria bacterium]|nr:lipoyl synthase [candidate division Zixibacteria bacterium]
MTKNPLSDTSIKPSWLKVRACADAGYLKVQSLLKEHGLHTVCQEANCPNRGECFSQGTATFLIMGPNCSRNCRFCNVASGDLGALDDREPANVAETVAILKLRHAVITSVTRDDLPDGGAGHFVRVIKAIRDLGRDVTIEVLTPDFQGDTDALNAVFRAAPEVFNHNVETVSRLYPAVRPAADYDRSLMVLHSAAQHGGMMVKSGLMVGLGETVNELEQVFHDLHIAGVGMLTIGQYLAPSKLHHPIVRYYHPDEFDSLAENARRAGIAHVFSGPLVRSSYHAAELFHRS